MTLQPPAYLRCEYMVDPLGLGERRPRLSWEVRDSRRGAKQTAYQVVAASSEQKLATDQYDLWDTGRVSSDQSIHVEYGGPDLGSRQRVHWRVRTWDAAGTGSPWSPMAQFELGLLAKSDWQAKWIGSTLVGGPRTMAPAPYLRKAFRVDGQVVSARLYISALGVYDCSINGSNAIGNDVLRPGWTEYHRRVQYHTYDVTKFVKSGDNAIGAILGDGWYCGHVSNRDRQTYGDRPWLLAQLEVTTADGKRHTIVSDTSWRWSAGPILENDMIMGEAHDARREMPGWDTTSFDDAAWQTPVTKDDVAIAIDAPPGPPTRRIEELKPVADPVDKGGWILDLGQNMVGWARLRFKGKAGRTVRIRYGEMLQDDGKLYTQNLRSARATDYYTLRGDEAGETWEPKFTFHGFRYVELTGLEEKPTRDAVTGVVVHTDMPQTGQFETSDELLNKLQSNIRWGQKGNFLDIPTDCPQRDERLGWTGDAQVFAPTACFNMDVAAFFTKWRQDLEDSQGSNGAVPPIIPDPKPEFGLDPGDAGPAWSDAMVIIPWTIYQCYGDVRILERHYEPMRKYVAHLESIAHDSIRVHNLHDGWGGFGDWLAIDNQHWHVTPTPKDLIGTAYWALDVRLVREAARILGKTDEVARLDALYRRIYDSFNREFVTSGGRVVGNSQTGYALALGFDMVPEERWELAGRYFVKTVHVRQWHLTTGFVGTPLLLPVLSKVGATQDAYKVLMQRTYPGWLYSVLQGATTIWERWNSYTKDGGFGDVNMNSFNHYAYGSVGQWMYSTIAGINIDPARPAYKHTIFKPEVGGGLTHARASVRSMYGEVAAAWRVDGKRFTYELTVPPNTTATLRLPARDANGVTEGGGGVAKAQGVTVGGFADNVATYELTAGRYTFASELPELPVKK